MARLRISMRWWLTLAFALIAAVTALAVGLVLSNQSKRAFQERAEEIAVGGTVAAADRIVRPDGETDLDEKVQTIADRRRLALFVFDAQGTLLTAGRSNRVNLENVPALPTLLGEALEGQRAIGTFDDGRVTVVALPLRSSGFSTRAGGPGGAASGEPAAVVSYAIHPDIAAGIGIVREEVVEAALWAILVGAITGLVVAILITRRIRRIATAAAAIERGHFDQPLEPRFPDELGSLAATIDGMRLRLQESFERMASERDRLERLLGRLQDGVITFDRSLEIEFANSAAQRLLGVLALEEGDPLPEPWPDLSLRRLGSSLFDAGALPLQARVSPDGDRTYAIVGLPAPSERESAVIVVTDISEAERRERAEREFVTNAAHELRTPITAISGAVEVLQAGAKEVPEERDRFLGHIERESARLGRLIRALLTLARAQTGVESLRPQPVELRPLLEDVAASGATESGVALDVRCPSDLAVLADRDLAEQALTNLVANAFKHTPDGGVVLAGRPYDGEAVAIEVVDTGSGIPLPDQERIFDRFYRGGARTADGFGLGLAIVREVVRALGGRIEVDSAPGRGTTMRVILPRATQKAA